MSEPNEKDQPNMFDRRDEGIAAENVRKIRDTATIRQQAAEIVALRARIAELEADAARVVENEREKVRGWDRFLGPCPHGRDPWTRCDDPGGCVEMVDKLTTPGPRG